MSIEAINAAFKAGSLSPSEKLVLIMLANFANEDHQAWPSRKKIEDYTGLSQRSIVAIKGKLCALGYISSDIRTRPNGSHTSILYTLHIERWLQCDARPTCAEIAEVPRKNCTGPMRNLQGTYAAIAPPEPILEPILENISSDETPKADLSAIEEQIWGAATKTMRVRSGKAKVAKAIANASRKITPLDLLAALKNYVATDKDVKAGLGQPALDRWIREERWEHWTKRKEEPIDRSRFPEDFWRRRISEWERGGKWPDGCGPAPDKPGCIVADLVPVEERSR
jgi:hypothetical protein